MFGSTRKKATAIVSNRSWFRRSGIRCSGDHPHEPWGKTKASGRTVWATSLESAYTPELSRAWVSCVATALRENLAAAPASRKRKHKEMCEPDFDDRVILFADEAVPFQQMFPPCRVPKSMKKWPKGSRLLALDEIDCSAHLAVPWCPERWCQRAMSLQHPRSMSRAVHGDLETAISVESASDPAALARRRTEECKRHLCHMQIQRGCRGQSTTAPSPAMRLDTSVCQTSSCLHFASCSIEFLTEHPAFSAQSRVGFSASGWMEHVNGTFPLNPQYVVSEASSL